MSGINKKANIENLSYLSAHSLAETFNCDAINMEDMDNLAIVLHWTGSAVGAFTMQMSNDGIVWASKTLSPTVTPNNAEATALIDITTAAKYVRLVYTATSGTGSVSASLFAKASN